jgi:two-component system, OmpR family, sensor kinase
LRAVLWTARTRIIGWVLLLVLGALAIITSIQATDERMECAAVRSGRVRRADDHRDQPAHRLAVRDRRPRGRGGHRDNIARPDEKFLGYVDGALPVAEPP